MVHHILAAFILAAVACPAFAQDKIVRIIDDLEKKNDVTTTYSERRTKKKHKLYRTTRVLTFNNQNYYRRLEKAFEEERPNSISAVKSNGTRSYCFADDKGTSTFTLTSKSVVMSWRDSSVPDGEEDGSCNIDIRGLEGLAELSCLGDLNDLASLQQWSESQRDWAKKQQKRAKKQQKRAKKQQKRFDRHKCPVEQ